MNNIAKIVVGILIVILAFTIGYSITLVTTGIIMWALVKLGIITAWTWGQAALWALIVYIIYLFFFKSNKNDN